MQEQLLDHTVEVLALWKVLCDHQLHLLGQSLSAEMRMSLKTTLLRDLILSGSDTCIALIISLILRYLEDVASTDAISEKLRQMLEMEKLDPHHRTLQCYNSQQ